MTSKTKIQTKPKVEEGEIFSYSWKVETKDTDNTTIRIYGLTHTNENICVIVPNFTPYCYLELPDNIEWTDAKASMLSQKLNSMSGDQQAIISSLHYKKRLYYASMKNNKKRLFPYLFCNFSHTEHIKQLSFKIRRPITIPGLGTFSVKMHENNANPILQLTALRKLPTAGWIKFTGQKVMSDKFTHCTHEYIVKWKELTPVISNKIAKPLIMSFDLEVNSSIPSSMPKAHRGEDKIFQCSCIFSRQGSKDVEKYLLTLGEPDLNILGKDITPLTFDTENDLLLGFTEIVQKKQPNIIVGYNIFGFDIPYMIDRAKLNFCFYDFDKLGMDVNGHAIERTIEWSSSAYKNQSFQFLDAEGRLFVDLLPLVKRDYKLSDYKLKTVASHFLKDINKDPLDAKGIFKCYAEGMKGGAKGKKAIGLVGKYAVQDSYVVTKLFETLTMWIGLCEMSKVTGVPIFSLYTQGQQLKVFSQVYRKCTHENIVVERDKYVLKDNDYYVGATVFPPVPGLYEKVIPFDFASLYPSAIIAKNICWSTLVRDDDTEIPDSSCHIMEWDDHIGCEHDPKEIRKKEITSLLKIHEVELKTIRAKRDAKENKHIIEEIKEELANKIREAKPLRDERSQLNKSKNKHIICCHRKYKWLKEPKGVLPEILSDLLDARATTKKELKTAKNTVKEMQENKTDLSVIEELNVTVDVLDQRQLSVKVSANSGYGIMGARKGYLTLMPGAMCTTYYGRTSIEKAAESIQKDHKGVLIYGDTDSNYVSFPHLKTARECWDYAIKVAEEVSKLFPKPMKMAFEEKIYWMFFILTKKRYMSLACERDGVLDTKIGKKGVLLQRRDNCEAVRKIYGDVIMMIFKKISMNEIYQYIINEFNNICSASIPIASFTVTKSVGSMGWFENENEQKNAIILTEGVNDKGKNCLKIGDYTIRKRLPYSKNEAIKELQRTECVDEVEYYLHSMPAQAQLANKMRQRGQLVAAGSRIEYVITTTGGHTAKQFTKVESSDYYAKHAGSIYIDYLYYIKQLANPLDQMLNIVYKNQKGYVENVVLQQYKLRLLKQKCLKSLLRFFAPKLVFST